MSEWKRETPGMFYLFIFILCCDTAAEDKNYRGFNKGTIEILDVHDVLSGYFTVRRKK